MKGLERFPEPWSVEDRGKGWLAILDANGGFIVGFQHREDLHRIDPLCAQTFLTLKEGFALARGIARLPELDRRPQY